VPEQLHILFYEYVPDVVERRGPYRDGHLGLIRRWYEEGRIVMAGGVGDPVRSGMIVLRADDPQAAAEEFVAEDPYQPAGLVTSWHVEPFLNVTS
jgi:uncharacterized protein